MDTINGAANKAATTPVADLVIGGVGHAAPEFPVVPTPTGSGAAGPQFGIQPRPKHGPLDKRHTGRFHCCPPVWRQAH